jgi:hypothetical protein
MFHASRFNNKATGHEFHLLYCLSSGGFVRGFASRNLDSTSPPPPQSYQHVPGSCNSNRDSSTLHEVSGHVITTACLPYKYIQVACLSPPNTARCCSEHDPATAWLTSEWPETFTLQVAHCRNVMKGPSIRPLGQSTEQGRLHTWLNFAALFKWNWRA